MGRAWVQVLLLFSCAKSTPRRSDGGGADGRPPIAAGLDGDRSDAGPDGGGSDAGCILVGTTPVVGQALTSHAQMLTGATLEVVRAGLRAIGQSVDDTSSGCVSGFHPGGPFDAGDPCAGSLYGFAA